MDGQKQLQEKIKVKIFYVTQGKKTYEKTKMR